jgi:hypothetical protein
MKNEQVIYYAYLLSIIQFAAATVVFLLQGGYGGGHDMLLFIFQLPGSTSILLIGNSIIESIWFSDYVMVVMVSSLLNVVIYSLLVKLDYMISLRIRAKRNHNQK